MTERSSSGTISTKLQRVAELARQAPEMAMTTLAHHIDEEFLREAFKRTRKDAATGVDGQTARDFEENLEENLSNLLEQFKTGTYKALPVRRVYIPKADGRRTRPIGVPTFVDKVLQRAVSMVLEAIYEQDFLGCSYGFRPNRSAHDALEALWKGLMNVKGGWVIELDIKSYYDNIDRSHLRSFLDQRVRDGVIRRMIDKWLNAGVMEQGNLSHPHLGTPQGGVISPILSNIYLHEVLDKWFEREVKPRMRGQAYLIRFADDAVMVFEQRGDAERVGKVLGKRFEKFGLKLHEEKTRMIEFQRPGSSQQAGGGAKPKTFDFLGFNHHWGKSQKGRPVVKRKTAKSRFKQACKRVAEWCRGNRHRKVREQWAELVRKLRGHYGYYGVTGNSKALDRFGFVVRRTWLKWLNRRSQKKSMSWEEFNRMLKRYPLPNPKVVHSVSRQAASL